jgi:hypothetical protein
MSDLKTVQNVFVQWMPMMQCRARRRFLNLPPDLRQEAVANSLALAWKFFYALFRQGRADEPEVLKSCIYYAVKQTKCGRTIQSKSRCKDALDHRRTGKAKFSDFDLSNFIGRNTPIPDQVSFRLDVPAFFRTLTSRQRAIAADLATGMATKQAAEKYGVTPAMISQFRARFRQLFDAFFAA